MTTQGINFGNLPKVIPCVVRNGKCRSRRCASRSRGAAVADAQVAVANAHTPQSRSHRLLYRLIRGFVDWTL